MFKTYRPETIDETLKVIQEPCHIFAGGTDLMIRKRQWQGAERKFTQPVVYINHLEELRGIDVTDTHYVIGTLTTQTDMCESDLPAYLTVPYSLMSSPAIRNAATVGGNIVNAASVADSLPLLYALDAEVELLSLAGKRNVPIESFIIDKYKTDLKQGELLTKVMIPKFKEKTYKYKKIGQRKASILSKLSVFILYNDSDIRIAIGAVNDTVIRDRILEENYLRDRDLDALLKGYFNHMKAKDDKRSTKIYKEKVVLNLLESFIKEIENGL